MTTPDPCAKKLAQLVAALAVEAGRLEGLADENRELAERIDERAITLSSTRAWATHHAQTAQAKRLREIVEEAGK